jgi:hypothetical protein
MKKTLIMVAILMMAFLAWGQYSGSGTFNKITSIDDLTDGYYVIANSGEAFAMNNTNAGSYFQHTAITPSSGSITDPSTAIVWEIKTDGAGRTVYNHSSAKYVSYSGSSNAAYAVDSVSDNARWTITYASNVFTFANYAISTRMLQYNASSPRFACYTTAQQKLVLYKLDDSAPETPIINVEPVSLLNFLYVEENGPSTEQTFTISGTYLTGNISIAASDNYEISETEGSNYTTPIVLTQIGGIVSPKTIYVRLKANLTPGNYNNENIIASSNDADDKTITCNGKVIPSGYYVNFEGVGETKTAYASGTVSLSGLDWDMTEALIGDTATDWKNGVRSTRMRGYAASSMTMLEDKPNGLGTISFDYRRYGTDSQVDWMVEYSTNGGLGWTQIGSAFTAPASDVVQTFSETVNIIGNIRVRIKRATEFGATNNRLNIDDILITNFFRDPSAGDLLITEVVGKDVVLNDDGYVEIWNKRDETFSLNNLGLRYYNGAGPSTLDFSGTIGPKGYIIVAVDKSKFDLYYNQNADFEAPGRHLTGGIVCLDLYNNTAKAEIIDSFNYPADPWSWDGGMAYFRNSPESGFTFTNWTETSDTSPGGPEHWLAVTMSSFYATFAMNNLTIYWSTASEVQNAGWNIYRSNTENYGQALKINPTLIEGAGTTAITTEYSYKDQIEYNHGETYYYWIESVDYANVTVLHGPVSVEIPQQDNPDAPPAIEFFGLAQNYPNPFNPTTDIMFKLKNDSHAKISVYNVKGEKVATIFDGYVKGGEAKSTQWNGTNQNGKTVASGIYFYRLESSEKTEMKKLVIH